MWLEARQIPGSPVPSLHSEPLPLLMQTTSWHGVRSHRQWNQGTDGGPRSWWLEGSWSNLSLFRWGITRWENCWSVALAASLVPLAHTGEHLGVITTPSNKLLRFMDSWNIYTAKQTALVMAATGPSHIYVTRHHSWKTQYGGLTHKHVWESGHPSFSRPPLATVFLSIKEDIRFSLVIYFIQVCVRARVCET